MRISGALTFDFSTSSLTRSSLNLLRDLTEFWASMFFLMSAFMSAMVLKGPHFLARASSSSGFLISLTCLTRTSKTVFWPARSLAG